MVTARAFATSLLPIDRVSRHNSYKRTVPSSGIAIRSGTQTPAGIAPARIECHGANDASAEDGSKRGSPRPGAALALLLHAGFPLQRDRQCSPHHQPAG